MESGKAAAVAAVTSFGDASVTDAGGVLDAKGVIARAVFLITPSDALLPTCDFALEVRTFAKRRLDDDFGIARQNRRGERSPRRSRRRIADTIF